MKILTFKAEDSVVDAGGRTRRYCPLALVREGFTPVSAGLPAPGVACLVVGDYVPAGTGFPVSCIELRDGDGAPAWSGQEWRGMVGVTHYQELAGVFGVLDMEPAKGARQEQP